MNTSRETRGEIAKLRLINTGTRYIFSRHLRESGEVDPVFQRRS